MDVPFSSSGALSRRHYGLVRAVESSRSIQEANNALQVEIQAVRLDMARADLTRSQCMEYLIILLYCFNAVEIGFSPGSISFALSHAVNLAEAGKTIEQKRIGYAFCAELMPPDSDMQLMLVNTIRKDLESSSVAKMCLALQSLIATPTEHVVPAVQSRVQELISHNSPQIRRRAIHACRLLSRHERSLLIPVAPVLLKRLGDPDYSVVGAALLAVSSPAFRNIVVATQLPKVESTIHDLAFNNDVRPYVLNMSVVLSAFGITFEDGISRLCDYIRDSAKKHDFLMLREAFRLLSQYTAEQLKRNLDVSPVLYIRNLLTSDDPNLHYLFLVCLDSLDAEIWSGSTDSFPSVLDDWEMEKIMHMIDSPDVLIRTKTLSVLNRVDQNIVDAVCARLLQSLPPNSNNRMRDECIVRLLEVVNTRTVGDGESYARGVAEILASVEGTLNDQSVSEAGVDRILSYIQYSSDMFQVQCAASLLAMITEEELNFGPTMLVVISALSAQYCAHVSIPPAKILSGIALHLEDVPASVQDACILAMLRLAGICDVSDAVKDTIARIYDNAGRHIKKRCRQFQTLVQEKGDLQTIIKKSRSSSLPDFLHSLESYESETLHASRPQNFAMSQSSTSSSSKLRYEAYDTPQLTPKLRSSRGRSSHHNHSEVNLNTSAAEMGEDSSSDQVLTTMTDAMSRVDLIAFDLPAALITDDRTAFSAIWDTMEAPGCDVRGWSDAKVEDLISNLQALGGFSVDIIPAHEPPFYGEVKLKITTDHEQRGAVKLRASEEGGTLWRVRTEGIELGKLLKGALTKE